MAKHPIKQNSPTHVEPSQQGGNASENPLGTSLNVVVSVPEIIEVRMVNASSLADYEMWVFLTSVLCNALVGFGVAYFQACDSNAGGSTMLFWMTVIWGVLFIATAIKAYLVRKGLTKTGKNISLRATEIVH